VSSTELKNGKVEFLSFYIKSKKPKYFKKSKS